MINTLINRLFKKDSNSTTNGIDNYPLMHEYNATRNKEKTTVICHAPSTNMYFSQTGEVKVCCHNSEFVAGKYPEQSINEIWNSNAIKQMRKDMAKYKLGNGCEICSVDLTGKNFGEVRALHFDHIPSNSKYPTQMEFLLTNTCNLECVMCKGEFSSLIRKNIENLPPIPNVYDDKFIQQLEEFIPYLHETRFSGSGEAFLIEANYKIWEKIISINPACKIMVQTNGTVLNNKVKEVLSKGNFQIGVSLDSLKKEVFESIRPNSKFERVIENTHYFNEYCLNNNRKFNISTCVMRQNWMEMPDFVNFSNKIKAVQTFHKVWFPRQYALFNLTSSELEKIYFHLASYDFSVNASLERLNRNHYKYFQIVVEQWYKEAKSKEEEKLKLSNAGLDALRDIAFQRIKNYLLENNENFDGNIELSYKKITDRITQLIDMLILDSLKKKVLREICTVDIKSVIEALKNNSANQLLKMAKDHLPID